MSFAGLYTVKLNNNYYWSLVLCINVMMNMMKHSDRDVKQ